MSETDTQNGAGNSTRLQPIEVDRHTERRTTPAAIYASRVLTTRLLWLALVVMTLLAIAGPIVTMALMKSKQEIARQVALLDGSESVLVANMVDPVTSKEMQDTLALLATQCLLNRNPAGFESEEIMKRLYLPSVAAKAHTEFAGVAQQFKSSKIYQSVRVGRIVTKILDPDHVAAKVIGQIDLIEDQNGERTPDTQAVTLEFQFVRNPYLGKLKLYPLIVKGYTYLTPEKLPEQQ
jgi:hypothetical protein